MRETRPLVWAGVGAALLLIGMVLAAVLMGGPLIWLFGRAYRALFGQIGRLAQLNSVRQPRRTAATAATLMIGLALVTAVAILAASTTTSVRDRLSTDQRGDFTISPVAYQPFDAKVADEARSVDGVEAVYEFYRGATVLGEDPVTLVGLSSDAFERAAAIDLVAGSLRAEGDALPAVIASDVLEREGLALGQLTDLVAPGGQRVTVLVTGIHDEERERLVGDVFVTITTKGKERHNHVVELEERRAFAELRRRAGRVRDAHQLASAWSVSSSPRSSGPSAW